MGPISLEEHYQAVSGISLGPGVPADISETFDRARNAFLYGWFVYELGSVAELQAFSTLELALRFRLGVGAKAQSPGLYKLIKQAVDEDILKDDNANRQQTLATLVSALRKIGLTVAPT